MTFQDLKLTTPLLNALNDLGFETPTAIQAESFSVILSGRDMIGVAQTGTGKTFAYLLPILRQLPFSKQKHPRVLIVVPTRELVLQVAGEVEKLTKDSCLTGEELNELGVYPTEIDCFSYSNYVLYKKENKRIILQPMPRDSYKVIRVYDFIDYN